MFIAMGAVSRAGGKALRLRVFNVDRTRKALPTFDTVQAPGPTICVYLRYLRFAMLGERDVDETTNL